MLQQTPVSRVQPKWLTWMERWPTPALLAATPVAEVIRAWQGLGYPRRALRLHEAAGRITHTHGGQVPDSFESLRSLPGVGDYTASAVLAFAYGQWVPVLDTNVRRVISRWLGGVAQATASVSRQERQLAQALLPDDGTAPTWSVAVMELGALVCTARGPLCGQCPLRRDCAWVRNGSPAATRGSRRPKFAGSDRQARGFLLRAVASGTGTQSDLIASWLEQLRGGAGGSGAGGSRGGGAGGAGGAEQAARALASLRDDGLVVIDDGVVRLPGP